MTREKYYRKYVRSNIRRNLAKHDDFYTSHKNLYSLIGKVIIFFSFDTASAKGFFLCPITVFL